MTTNTEQDDSLVNWLERAKENPEEDHHLSIRARRLLQRLEEGGEEEREFIGDRLDRIEKDHPLIHALSAVYTWEESNHQDFENGAKAGIEHFDESYRIARDKGWYGVAVLSLRWAIKLRANLGGFDPHGRLEEGLDLLESEYRAEDVHLDQFSTILDLVIEHADSDRHPLHERTL